MTKRRNIDSDNNNQEVNAAKGSTPADILSLSLVSAKLGLGLGLEFAFQRTVDVLLAHTQEYWNLSSLRCGRNTNTNTNANTNANTGVGGIGVTMGDAITLTGALQGQVGPFRPLSKSLTRLSDSLIIGPGKRQKKIPLKNLYHLPKAQ